MVKIQEFFKLIDFFFLSVWGLTLMDLIPLISINFLDDLDGIIKTLMALSGFLYFVITIPHKVKMNRLEKKIKEEELEALEFENEQNKKNE